MSKLSPETIEFINKHRKDDVRQLALQSKKDGKVDINEAVTQIAGWQIAEKKIPSWSKIDSIIYPKHLSMEQCMWKDRKNYVILQDITLRYLD